MFFFSQRGVRKSLVEGAFPLHMFMGCLPDGHVKHIPWKFKTFHMPCHGNSQRGPTADFRGEPLHNINTNKKNIWIASTVRFH